MAGVDINFSLSKEDLSCCICYDDVPFPLIRCTNSLHFVCKKCYRKCHKNCPQCRTSVINCDNEGCPLQMFEWSHQQHQSECCYKQFNCMFCNSLLSIPSLKEHLKECSEYVEKLEMEKKVHWESF